MFLKIMCIFVYRNLKYFTIKGIISVNFFTLLKSISRFLQMFNFANVVIFVSYFILIMFFYSFYNLPFCSFYIFSFWTMLYFTPNYIHLIYINLFLYYLNLWKTFWIIFIGISILYFIASLLISLICLFRKILLISITFSWFY